MELDPASSARSLYEILGVPADAAAPAIRSAYRNLSRTNHPDAGGDASIFAELTLARDVLCDPVMRKQYDDTGVVPRNEAKNQAAALLTALGQLRQESWLKVVQAGGDPLDCDMVTIMRSMAKEKIDAYEKQAKGLGLAIGQLRKCQGLWSIPSLDDPNYMQMVDNGHIDTLSKQIAHFESQSGFLRVAMDYLNCVTFTQIRF